MSRYYFFAPSRLLVLVPTQDCRRHQAPVAGCQALVVGLCPVFARISGYTPDEMKTLPTETVLGLMHPDDQMEVERVMAESMSGTTGKGYHVEYRFNSRG